MKEEIIKKYRDDLSMVGVASVDRFEGAPKDHHPADILKNARSVIVIAKSLPKGVLLAKNYTQHFIHRSQHSIYDQLNDTAMDIIDLIEKEGHHAVPVPAFVPFTFRKFKNRGILSLKHAAEKAGMGLIGKNDLLYNEKHGALLRFAAVITDLELTPDPLIKEKSYCPDNCDLCMTSCPAQAIKKDQFHQTKCLKKAIYHGVDSILLFNLKRLEKFLNTTYGNYWMNCSDCLLLCPINQKILNKRVIK